MIDQLIRKNIRSLQPYSSARDEFKGTEGVFLDANENPFGTLNRYPDPYQNKLKDHLSKIKNVSKEMIFIGNGSDEVIDLLFRLFCEPGTDQVLIFPPTYGMYTVSANINDVQITEIPLTESFQLNKEAISLLLKNQNQPPKLCFVCSPNNPTGNCINDIEWLCRLFPGIVVVDEAYIDFSNKPSMINSLDKHDNLVVMQTFSKALALASARVGVAYTSAEIIQWLNKIKPPYNVSKLNQRAALKALASQKETEKQVDTILDQRNWLRTKLAGIPFVKTIYPSDANFLFLQVDNATKRYNELVNKWVIVRNRTKLVNDCLRITVGKPEENKTLLNALRDIS